MVNRVILVGNLGRDPEVRRLENGTAVAKFSVATNEGYKDKNGEWQNLTEWHDVVVWRNLAERAERDLKKGSKIYLEGKLTHRKWQDKEGNNRRTTEVVAAMFRSLDKRESSGQGGEGYFPSTTDEMPATNAKAPAKPTTAEVTEKQNPVDDDLPF